MPILADFARVGVFFICRKNLAKFNIITIMIIIYKWILWIYNKANYKILKDLF